MTPDSQTNRNRDEIVDTTTKPYDHMILLYDGNMSAKPVQVSLDLGLLRRIDADPETGEKCCVNLCNVFTVAQADLRQFVGTADPAKMRAVCRALGIAMSCD